jgi:hypothetical protein
LAERIHALRTVSGEGDSALVSATVATLEDAYTDADLFETVSQVRGDGNVPSPVASSSSFLAGIYSLPRNGNNLTLTRSKKSWVCLVLPRLVSRCYVPIGITPLSRVELVKLACAVMDPSTPLQSFASPKHRPRASISHVCVCSLPCPLPWVSSRWVQTALTPMQTPRRLPKRHTSGLTTPMLIGISLVMERKLNARWYYQYCTEGLAKTP